MDMDDMLKQAKSALNNVSDEQIDEGAEMLKGKTPDQVDDLVDKAADFLEGMNDK